MLFVHQTWNEISRCQECFRFEIPLHENERVERVVLVLYLLVVTKIKEYL